MPWLPPRRMPDAPYSLRTRFLAFAALIGVVCFAVFLGAWQPKVARTFTELETGQAERQLSVLGNALIPYLLQNQFGAVHEILQHGQDQYPEWIWLELVDADGTRLFPLTQDTLLHTPAHVRLTQPITFGGRTIATLSVTLDLGQRLSVLRAQVNHLGLVMMTVLGLAALVTLFVLDRMILRRVAVLSDAACRIAEGDYSTRLPQGGGDEIGQMVDSFAAMREEIKSKEQSLTQARDVAEAAVETKTRFLATMSHEIRTPLNGILPVADMLLDEDLTPSQRDQLSIIRNAGHTLKSVIDDILDISKLEAGELLIRLEHFDLAETVRRSVSVLSAQARQRQIALEVDIGPTVAGLVRGDGDRLSQVLINLTGNAVKFTDEGSVTVRVERGTKAEQDRVTFEVCDTGIGIAAEDHDRVFERFAQVDSTRNRKFSGSGLGLSISAALVEAMGGQIRLDSAPGQGSRFWFTLELPPVAARVPSAAGTVPYVPDPSDALLVLVVDDSLVNVTVTQAMLTRLGHRSEAVSSGAEAIARVAAGGVDLVLMDQHMPEMDGLEATRRIRALPGPEAEVMISGLTASIFAEDITNCLNAGMDEFLAKPITRDDLREVLALCAVRRKGLPDTAAGLHDPAVARSARKS